MNLANRITLLRILLIPLFLIFFSVQSLQPWGSYLAAATFALAALTDTVDGYIARFQKQVTTLGKFLDPLADKLLISTALVALVAEESLSVWVAMVIISRELLVTGLRLAAAAKAKIITASTLSKLKTTSQIVAVIAIILNPSLFILGKSLGSILMTVALFLTVFSGLDYFAKNWSILVSAETKK